MDIQKQHEDFDLWWEGNAIAMMCEEDEALKIWQAAKAQAVPEGFTLVDIEKQHQIRDQALNAKYASLNNDSDRIFSDIEDVQLSIEAMIEAQEQNQ